MDPNEALKQILRGCRIGDHVEALRDWIGRGGFAPDIEAPDDTMRYIKALLRYSDTPGQVEDSEPVRVSANFRGLLVLRARNWVPLISWADILEASHKHDLDVLENLTPEELPDPDSVDSSEDGETEDDTDDTDDLELDDDEDTGDPEDDEVIDPEPNKDNETIEEL
jgi:hypothetical protein